MEGGLTRSTTQGGRGAQAEGAFIAPQRSGVWVAARVPRCPPPPTRAPTHHHTHTHTHTYAHKHPSCVLVEWWKQPLVLLASSPSRRSPVVGVLKVLVGDHGAAVGADGADGHDLILVLILVTVRGEEGGR